MAVRLTAPHPLHGAVGKVVSLDDPQAEKDLVTAGYAVEDDGEAEKAEPEADGDERPAPHKAAGKARGEK